MKNIGRGKSQYDFIRFLYFVTGGLTNVAKWIFKDNKQSVKIRIVKIIVFGKQLIVMPCKIY